MRSNGHFEGSALSDEISSLILREMKLTFQDMMMNEHSSSRRPARGRHLSVLSDECSSLRPHDDEESSLALGAPNNIPTLTIAQSEGSA